jgi:hypothetical protein
MRTVPQARRFMIATSSLYDTGAHGRESEPCRSIDPTPATIEAARHSSLYLSSRILIER